MPADNPFEGLQIARKRAVDQQQSKPCFGQGSEERARHVHRSSDIKEQSIRAGQRPAPDVLVPPPSVTFPLVSVKVLEMCNELFGVNISELIVLFCVGLPVVRAFHREVRNLGNAHGRGVLDDRAACGECQIEIQAGGSLNQHPGEAFWKGEGEIRRGERGEAKGCECIGMQIPEAARIRDVQGESAGRSLAERAG